MFFLSQQAFLLKCVVTRFKKALTVPSFLLIYFYILSLDGFLPSLASFQACNYDFPLLLATLQ